MMPGDFWRRKKADKIRCAVNALSNGDNGTLLPHNKVIETLKIYVEVTGCLTCGGPIAMEYIPSIHADGHVINVTMIWTADLSPFVKRTHLSRILKETEGTTTSSMEKAIRLSFSLEDDDKRNFQLTSGKRLTHLATVDIPLSTGVVGHGGPQIRTPFSNVTNKGETLSNKLSPSLIAHKPVDVSLCVAVHGEKALRHLPEFVLHHLNVGKGLAKYMGIWDVDEYWLPPLTTKEWLLPDKSTMNGRMPDAIASLNHRFGRDLWQESYYSKVPSILTVMESIQAYHDLNNCGEDWCFHAFPSMTAYRRRVKIENETNVLVDGKRRTYTIHGDFERRDKEPDLEWSKSVTRTKNAQVAGTHMSGSCRWPSRSPDLFVNHWDVEWSDEAYSDARYLEMCRNLRIKGFGLMHHFYSLNLMRNYDFSEYREELPLDEYARYFSHTVQKQLGLL
eukprot:scaffold8817_cov148-Skeletonema_menzelii.AAC.1